MEEEQGRGRQNQSEFRYANTRFMHALAGRNPAPNGQLIPFLCECADRACWDPIRITAARYGAIHVDDLDYVIRPGHLRIADEEILEENGYYEVVKKAA